MQKFTTQSGLIPATVIGLLLAFFCGWDGDAMAQGQPGPPAGGQAGGQVLNMRDADIRAFISDVSMLTGKTFVVDPRVQGKVTVISQEQLSGDDIFALFLST